MESSSSFVPQFNPSQSPNYGFTVPNLPSPIMRAFMTYIDALEAWSLRDIMACFDEALEHRILPHSLGRPVLNKRQYGEYLRAVMPLMKRCQVLTSTYSLHLSFTNAHCPTYQITIHEVTEAGDKITAHVRICNTYQTTSLDPTSAPTLGLKKTHFT